MYSVKFHLVLSLSGHYLVGLDDIEQESDFRWLNGEPLY